MRICRYKVSLVLLILWELMGSSVAESARNYSWYIPVLFLHQDPDGRVHLQPQFKIQRSLVFDHPQQNFRDDHREGEDIGKEIADDFRRNWPKAKRRKDPNYQKTVRDKRIKVKMKVFHHQLGQMEENLEKIAKKCNKRTYKEIMKNDQSSRDYASRTYCDKSWQTLLLNIFSLVTAVIFI